MTFNYVQNVYEKNHSGTRLIIIPRVIIISGKARVASVHVDFKEHYLDWLKKDFNVTEIITVQDYKYTKS